MKRSRALTLVLMAPAPLLLAGCDSAPEETLRKGFYTDVAACEKDGNAADVCQRALDNATKANEANAPKFKTKEECIAEFGDLCRERVVHDGASQSSMWTPLMTGFLISQLMSPRYPAGYYDVAPIYRFRNGQYTQYGDERGSGLGGAASGGGSTARSYRSVDIAPNRAVTVSRSGFGSVAAARSGWGGSSSSSSRGSSSGG
ncbi:DUF1190 domain-containing protein [Rudaea sp.]|uniref:DUF1190 domain-containing protein n=1 Tax=Rudaea sp. TaxID=2136325 RepID=UPI00321F6FB2